MKRSVWIFLMGCAFFGASFYTGSDIRSDRIGHVNKVTSTIRSYAAIKNAAVDFNHSLRKLRLQNQKDFPIPPSGCVSFVFNQGELEWWSENSFLGSITDTVNQVRFYQNGWYKPVWLNDGSYVFLTYILIKSQYPFTNRFLRNEFNPNLELCDYWVLASAGEQGAIAIDQDDGFWLKESTETPPPFKLPAWLMVLGIGLIMAGMVVFLNARAFSWAFSIWTGLSAILLIRLLAGDLMLGLPMWDLDFFNSKAYASSWILNSPVELLLVSIWLLTTAVLLPKLPAFLKTRKLIYPHLLSLSLLAFAWAFAVSILISGLVLNSTIPFDFEKLFSFNAYSLFGFLVAGILLVSLLLGIRAIVSISRNYPITNTFRFFSLSFFPFIGLTASVFIGPFAEMGILFATGMVIWLLLVYTYATKKEQQVDFSAYLSLTAGLALFAAAYFFHFEDQRERNERLNLAVLLESERDLYAEWDFKEVSRKIGSDPELISLLLRTEELVASGDKPADRLEQRILRSHLDDYYLNKYDVSARIFLADGIPVNSGGDPSWSLDLYDQQILLAGNDSSRYGFYYVGGGEGRFNYIGKVPAYHADTLLGTIVLSMQSKPLGNRSGFPELLYSEKFSPYKNLGDYSIGYYKSDTLVNLSGAFAYPLLFDEAKRLPPNRPNGFFKENGFSHLIHRTPSQSFLIISKRDKGTYVFTTSFSYLFALYGILFALAHATMSYMRNGWRWRLGIGQRIRISMVMVVIITMFVTGSATVWYIFNTYQSDGGPETENRIKTLMSAIRGEISSRYRGIPLAAGDELNFSLAGLAKALDTDFNLYDPNGQLLYSTQRKLYDQQIIAPLMDRQALNQMRSQSASFVSQREHIGGFEYISAYEPVREQSGIVKGYVNLSYFSQQVELEKRISGFLVAVLNLYVLLFAIASFVTVFLSARITQPLEILRQKLSGITFGKNNDKLDWPIDDEIGALVKEYNRKADELSAAAEQLAQSERESAWREMARQVAHEIKNPLTPMKLGLQHLHRAWKENHPDRDQILDRMTKVLIEQIDALSRIATEFSGFAQMPAARKSVFDLESVIRSVVELYAEHDQIRISIQDNSQGTCKLEADKEQIMRVFSNLIKNAVQAVDQHGKGQVSVLVKTTGDKVVVEVADNGSGIPDEDKPRIFSPNFTTKSGGTGLGLAICRQIIDQAGGHIWFESNKGVGTTFYVELPKVL